MTGLDEVACRNAALEEAALLIGGVHFIRDGSFVCTAEQNAPCRNYPDCVCEEWSPELHGEHPAEGHENVPQDECWAFPWLDATDLSDNYGADDLILSDDEFPDGPVVTEWHGDCLTWAYANDTRPVVRP